MEVTQYIHECNTNIPYFIRCFQKNVIQNCFHEGDLLMLNTYDSMSHTVWLLYLGTISQKYFSLVRS